MSLVFASIVPHSPLLIPEIGKENFQKLKKTSDSFEVIKKELEDSKAETLIIILSYEEIQSDSFLMNLCPEFTYNFKDFGNLTINSKIKGDIGLAHKIRESLETKAPLQMTSNDVLNYGSSVPIYLLTKDLPDLKIVPIYNSKLNNLAHFKFGQLLKREIGLRKRKIAIIASGDLSHRLTEDSPAGYSPHGKEFDETMIKLIQSRDNKKIINLNNDLIKDSAECGLKSILIFNGIIDGIQYKPKILSYEAPFGVGFLTVQFSF